MAFRKNGLEDNGVVVLRLPDDNAVAEAQWNGARVTLRKDRMWDFLDKLMNFALPRVRDFRGVPDKGFDGRGNFTMGIKEHTIFPELEADRVDNPKGMNITIVTSAETDKEGKVLLDHLGMPFRK
jgi:large subunit ribosomal protein L5